ALYGWLGAFRRVWPSISAALLAGCATAIAAAVGAAWLFGGSQSILLSLAPKSATMPIAMPLAEQAGGAASLAAVAVAVTGISGVMMAPSIFRLMGVPDPRVRGFAVGLAAHAIGTARAIQVNDTAGAFSALAMSLNGVATAVWVPLLVWLTRL